ncbi:tyrosine-type recombinase/integrase [Jeotgalibacillus proteolyticus]|uniref:Site-specific integrase n=1 Tax=Jeotgalibacillus proteolyticus TaxID=2082395 RepID=A0A2S5GFW3_9BACL|nr:tyrosine-type recombinase/integrase [Jeotgalibacillus proteolyticus]PPA71920.1 site-specific integrase [Jeotgalibacillus proteolyticus]
MNFVQPIRDLEKIEDIKRFLKQRSERNYMLFVVGINTGLRISDILQLKAGDVREMHIILKEKKTKKRKWIRITPSLRRELNPYIEDMKDHEYLFTSRQGDSKPIGRNMAYKILREAAQHHKLRDIGTHTLRKTFGYHFYLQNKNVAMLMDIFNHSEESITLRYIGVNQDVLDKAMSTFKI